MRGNVLSAFSLVARDRYILKADTSFKKEFTKIVFYRSRVSSLTDDSNRFLSFVC